MSETYRDVTPPGSSVRVYDFGDGHYMIGLPTDPNKWIRNIAQESERARDSIHPFFDGFHNLPKKGDYSIKPLNP